MACASPPEPTIHGALPPPIGTGVNAEQSVVCQNKLIVGASKSSLVTKMFISAAFPSVGTWNHTVEKSPTLHALLKVSGSAKRLHPVTQTNGASDVTPLITVASS